MDWITDPVREILPLIPQIKDNREGIDPPKDYDFVLRVGLEYFVRFHTVLPGPCTSLNLAKATRLENLVIVASYAVFIVRDSPNLKRTLFVEAVPKNGASAKAPVKEKLKARAVGGAR